MVGSMVVSFENGFCAPLRTLYLYRICDALSRNQALGQNCEK